MSTITIAVPGGVDPLGQPLVLVAHALVGVDHEERGVGTVDRLQRADQLKYSVGSSILLRRRMPAVSTKRSGPSSVSTTVSTASRVVPGHVVDDRALVADDAVEQRRLADVGTPDDRDREDAVVRSTVERRRGSGGSASTTASRRSPLPRPWMRRHRVRARRARAERSPTTRSRGGRRRPCWRRGARGVRCAGGTSATCASSSVMPTLTSTTMRITSASATARSAWALICRASGAARRPTVGASQPPVSTTTNDRPFQSAVEHLAVAGDAGLLLDDGVAAADEPVDQRRLPDVRPTDDRDHGSDALIDRTAAHRATRRRWRRSRPGAGGRRASCRRGSARSRARRRAAGSARRRRRRRARGRRRGR